MSREYRRIYCCADCVNYSMKKHKCMLGAKDEGSGREHFYRDCPLPIYWETSIYRTYEEGFFCRDGDLKEEDNEREEEDEQI